MADSGPIMSLEARAKLVGSIVNNTEFLGKPDARREAVEKLALEQLRAALAHGGMRHLADE